jgi:hypothetical protein
VHGERAVLDDGVALVERHAVAIHHDAPEYAAVDVGGNRMTAGDRGGDQHANRATLENGHESIYAPDRNPRLAVH